MENKYTVSYLHFSALLCVFSVADSIILMPLYSKNLIELPAAVLLGILIVLPVFKPLKKILEVKNSVVKGIIYAVIFALSLTYAVFAAREYTVFIYENLLIKANMFLIKLIFAVCAAYLASKGKDTIYKFSVLSAFFITAIFVIMFLISIKNFDILNLKTVFSFSDISFKHISDYCYRLFFPLLLAVLFISGDLRKSAPRFIVPSGVAWGMLLCVIVILDSILSFGLSLASKLKYPYIDDISTVTIGSIFTRMDGFAYFAFFVCYILKCAILIRLSSNILCNTGVKSQKYLSFILSVVLLI
ncbi:MAG: GerAB/ArcD/ProY family transporter [Clostridia bacterium]|nr:GerAB/ArcD/ProY family transporter [Clostridia bacterium]